MVSRIARKEVMGLADIMSTENFTMMFGNIPFFDVDPYTYLTLPCQNAEIPGANNQAFAVTLGSYTRMFRGRQDFAHTLNISFAIPRDMTTLNAIRTWHEGVAGSASQTSLGYQADYSTTADLYLFDTAGKCVDIATFYRLFPASVPDFQLQESQTSPMIGNITFHYDYVEWATTPAR